ncbi:hypothetical protein A2982_03910 [candidate division WWE3 bacterium RIFCSPLOWO2_01_FULL_39_13]|uniref:SUF system FeS cluster assembly SufBD core domain-containing protein n=1 Tax=candidate division WWE3 bacterium RIFCSPLOWO2_01_FULL_39_13 TaxID=1802624 RepID=A0A1F4V3T0_UNCKA|nr:MAG: hypothetical protein A2982_03910 [candidate division WWE3 bacterium RIFCSPLOWO2_01_FULL_39_13]
MEILTVNSSKIKKRIMISGNETIFLAGFGGGECDLEIMLKNDNASCSLYGIIIGKNGDNFRISTVSLHKGISTYSYIHIKSVLDGSSHLVYDGIIKVEKGARYSDSYLKNDNLLIGDNASVESSPKLEILDDDVKASHGVTISNIDSESIFYLMARGLSEQSAKDLYIKGFANDIIKNVSSRVELPSEILKYSYAKI